MWRSKNLLHLFGETRRFQPFLYVSWCPFCPAFIGVSYNIETMLSSLHLSYHCISFLQFIGPLVGQDEFRSVTLIWCQAVWAWYIGKQQTEASSWNIYCGSTNWWYNSFNFDFLLLLKHGNYICIIMDKFFKFLHLKFIYKVAVLSGLTMQFLWVLRI